MEMVSAQNGCPAITISNNNGNWSPSLPITQNTFNHCRQEKKDQYLIFQPFQYIIIFGRRFHLKNIWGVPKYKAALHCQLLSQKNLGMAVLSNLTFQPIAETLWYLLDGEGFVSCNTFRITQSEKYLD